MSEVRSALILHSVSKTRDTVANVIGFADGTLAGSARRRIVAEYPGQEITDARPDFCKLDASFVGAVTEHCPECAKQLTRIRYMSRELDHLESQLDVANEEHGFEAVPFDEGSEK